MEKYEITKQQILELAKMDVNQYQLKQWFPDVFEVKLEVCKWYKYKQHKNWLLCIKSINLSEDEILGYGFACDNSFMETDMFTISELKTCIEATEKEVKTALENEAVKVGYKENLQYVKCLCGFNEESSQEYYKNLKSNFYFECYENKLWIQDGSYLDICIFDNGKWAEITKTITLKEAEEKLGVKII